MGIRWYQQGWKKEFSWIQRVNSDAYIELNANAFQNIHNSLKRILQIKSPEKSPKSKIISNQRIFIVTK